MARFGVLSGPIPVTLSGVSSSSPFRGRPLWDKLQSVFRCPSSPFLMQSVFPSLCQSGCFSENSLYCTFACVESETVERTAYPCSAVPPFV